jgi:hypothetical protein
MEKKSHYRTVDGRDYDVTMGWDEKFRDRDHIFKITFQAIDRATGRPYALPREIATYQIGDPDENLGERTKWYYEGSRELLMTDYLTTAYRRACDYLERGR